MSNTEDRIQVLEALVDELMKDDPADAVVSECMKAIGLKDSKDPIDRINQVLKALHFSKSSEDFKE